MEIIKLDDIAPDGVRMIVDWGRMRTSDSVFIPCVNVAKALKQLEPIFGRRGWKMRTHVSIENNIMGLRIWRIA
jgi:hypothetical protein